MGLRVGGVPLFTAAPSLSPVPGTRQVLGRCCLNGNEISTSMSHRDTPEMVNCHSPSLFMFPHSELLHSLGIILLEDYSHHFLMTFFLFCPPVPPFV